MPAYHASEQKPDIKIKPFKPVRHRMKQCFTLFVFLHDLLAKPCFSAPEQEREIIL